MDKRKIRGVQLSAGHSIHYFQISHGELSMTVDCVHGNCIITEKELLSYLQSRNSLKSVERNDSGGVEAKPDSQQLKPKIRPTVPRCLKVGDCVDTGNADCVGCDYFSA